MVNWIGELWPNFGAEFVVILKNSIKTTSKPIYFFFRQSNWRLTAHDTFTRYSKLWNRLSTIWISIIGSRLLWSCLVTKCTSQEVTYDEKSLVDLTAGLAVSIRFDLLTKKTLSHRKADVQWSTQIHFRSFSVAFDFEEAFEKFSRSIFKANLLPVPINRFFLSKKNSRTTSWRSGEFRCL